MAASGSHTASATRPSSSPSCRSQSRSKLPERIGNCALVALDRLASEMGAVTRQLPHSWHSKARSFEISLLRARNQEKIPDHRLENRDTDGGRKEAQFPVVRQAMEKDI